MKGKWDLNIITTYHSSCGISPFQVHTPSYLRLQIPSHLSQVLGLNLHKHTRSLSLQHLRLNHKRRHKLRSLCLAIVVTHSVPATRWFIPGQENSISKCIRSNLGTAKTLPTLPRFIDLGLLIVHRTQHLTLQHIRKHVRAAMAMRWRGAIGWV